MENILKIIGGIFVVFLAVEFIRKAIGNEISNQLMMYLKSNKKEEFNKLIDSSKAKIFIHPYNRNFLKLSLAISDNDEKEVVAYAAMFEKVKISKKQKEAVYSRCFQYFLTLNNKKYTTHFYNKLKNNDVTKDHSDLDMIYDTYVEKGYKYLDKYLEKLSNAKDSLQISYESHISKMYENKGDKENAKKYRELSQQHLNNLS